MSLSYADTVAFLRRLGIPACDVLDDAPPGLWLTAHGLRLLIAGAPDSADTFAVRALLIGGPETAGKTIIITERNQTPRDEPPPPRRGWFPWLGRRKPRTA